MSLDQSTTRLYYDDSYLRRFRATAVTGADDPQRVYLDRTAFYPTSGGQPFDMGTLGEARVADVVEEEDGRIAHLTDRPVEPGAWVECAIDWTRRFDHMQQHTGQHLLSAVLADRFQLPTVSFHLGADSSTIDIETPSLDAARLVEAERRANEVVSENRPVTVSYRDSREPGLGLRKPSDRDGVIRVVTIEDLDRSACGGTHVRTTAEAGPIFLRKLDKIRGNVRIEFLCGLRAIARARADFDALASIARRFSAPLDEAPALAAAQAERLAEAEKLGRKLELEVARAAAREQYAAMTPDARGRRCQVVRLARGPIGDEHRRMAQAFAAAGPGALAAVVCAEPAAILLCVAAEGAAIKADALLKPLLARHGGRGGGSAAMAQGSLPSAGALNALWNEIAAEFTGPAADK